jgi:hypothetical protein
VKESNEQAELPLDMQKFLGGLILAVYVIGALTLVFYGAHFFRSHISNDPSDWGTLGDYFGGVMNPVVSFATLVVAFAVWKQQREELKATKEALEEQAKTAEQQRQEQRFFDLLNVYYRTLDSIQLDMPPARSFDTVIPVTDRHGKAAIQSWLEDRATDLSDLKKNLGDYVAHNSDKEQLLGFLRHPWDDSNGAEYFGAYLRTIESILTTASLVLKGNQDRYIKLFRSQLSQSELVLIGVFLLLEEPASSRLRDLCGQYGLLHHLVESDLRTLLQIHIPTVVADPIAT